MQFLVCLIAIVIIIIAEKGIPVKLDKEDYIIYGLTFIIMYIFIAK